MKKEITLLFTLCFCYASVAEVDSSSAPNVLTTFTAFLELPSKSVLRCRLAADGSLYERIDKDGLTNLWTNDTVVVLTKWNNIDFINPLCLQFPQRGFPIFSPPFSFDGTKGPGSVYDTPVEIYTSFTAWWYISQSGAVLASMGTSQYYPAFADQWYLLSSFSTSPPPSTAFLTPPGCLTLTLNPPPDLVIPTYTISSGGFTVASDSTQNISYSSYEPSQGLTRTLLFASNHIYLIYSSPSPSIIDPPLCVASPYPYPVPQVTLKKLGSTLIATSTDQILEADLYQQTSISTSQLESNLFINTNNTFLVFNGQPLSYWSTLPLNPSNYQPPSSCYNPTLPPSPIPSKRPFPTIPPSFTIHALSNYSGEFTLYFDGTTNNSRIDYPDHSGKNETIIITSGISYQFARFTPYPISPLFCQALPVPNPTIYSATIISSLGTATINNTPATCFVALSPSQSFVVFYLDTNNQPLAMVPSFQDFWFIKSFTAGRPDPQVFVPPPNCQPSLSPKTPQPISPHQKGLEWGFDLSSISFSPFAN